MDSEQERASDESEYEEMPSEEAENLASVLADLFDRDDFEANQEELKEALQRAGFSGGLAVLVDPDGGFRTVGVMHLKASERAKVVMSALVHVVRDFGEMMSSMLEEIVAENEGEGEPSIVPPDSEPTFH